MNSEVSVSDDNIIHVFGIGIDTISGHVINMESTVGSLIETYLIALTDVPSMTIVNKKDYILRIFDGKTYNNVLDELAEWYNPEMYHKIILDPVSYVSYDDGWNLSILVREFAKSLI